MKKTLIASGIFMWDAPERRTQRYGYVFVCDQSYEKNAEANPVFHKKNAAKFKGKKVKLTVKVVEARKSGHVGDLYIDVLPTQPEVGEEVTLGVGKFVSRINPFIESQTDIALIPDDGRSTYWFDPRNLYHLHDQTVEIYAETTKEPCHAAPDIKPVRKAGAISNGDGSIQLVGVDPKEGATIKVKPNFTRLGEGLFRLERPNAEGNKGEVFDVTE